MSDRFPQRFRGRQSPVWRGFIYKVFGDAAPDVFACEPEQQKEMAAATVRLMNLGENGFGMVNKSELKPGALAFSIGGKRIAAFKRLNTAHDQPPYMYYVVDEYR